MVPATSPVRRILSEAGFRNVLVVREQESLTLISVPSGIRIPEEKDAFKLAIELAMKEDVDLIIGITLTVTE